MEITPYLSIVATTRNDNHGGDLIHRTKCFVEGIYHQSQKYNLPLELIIIEWNPPQDKPLLKDVLPKPPEGSSIIIRYIIVPEYIHNSYSFSTRMPLFQMTAKNVGIRRVLSPFVLCTNIDLIFSDELFAFLAKQNLNENTFYRANRFDVRKEILTVEGFENKVSYAKKNIIKQLGKTKGNEYLVGIPGIFYGFTNTMKFINFLLGKLIAATHSRERFLMWNLDTSACGDFTLMSKKSWLKIEGYPELDLYSIHIDSMGIIAAIALDMKQEILPPEMCSYHIHHEDGWESFYDNPVGLIKFMERRPGLDWYSVSETGKWLIKHGKGWGLNKPDWGYANERFKEYIFEPSKLMQEIN
ncbi:MAG: hypothetical protein AB7G44_02845 [Bacteroidia bacterium]